MKPSRRIALAGVFAALIVALMAVISLIEVLDLSAAAFGGLIMCVCLIELGTATSFAVYAVAGLLSVLLVPNKGAALLFLLYAGFYPLLKQYFERIRPAFLSWLAKAACFALCAAAIVLLGSRLGIFVETLTWMFYPLAALSFIIYDITLYAFALFYIRRIKNRIKR